MPILEGWEGKAWGPAGSPSTKRPFFERVARGGPGGPLQKDLFSKMEGGGLGPEGPLQEQTFLGRMRGRGPGARGAPCKRYLFLKDGRGGPIVYYKPRK